MGEIKNLLERNRQIDSVANSVDNSIANLNKANSQSAMVKGARIAKEVAENLNQDMRSSMDLSTSTSSDVSQQGHSAASHVFDIFTDAALTT